MRRSVNSVSGALSRLLNKCLDADRHSIEMVAGLNGRCLHILIEPLGFLLEVRFVDSLMSVNFKESVQADVVISGELSDFLWLIGAHLRNIPGASGTVNVAGDLGTAQKVQSLFSNLNIDIEDVLSRFFQPVLAHQIYLVLVQGSSVTAENYKKMEDDVMDYLRYESTLLVKRADFNKLTAAATNFFDQVERFEARVELTSNQME